MVWCYFNNRFVYWYDSQELGIPVTYDRFLDGLSARIVFLIPDEHLTIGRDVQCLAMGGLNFVDLPQALS